jgi:hypothetical protein
MDIFNQRPAAGRGDSTLRCEKAPNFSEAFIKNDIGHGLDKPRTHSSRKPLRPRQQEALTAVSERREVGYV